MFGVKDVAEIQYGVVHSPCVKCHGVDGWVSIGCVGVSFLGGVGVLIRFVLAGCWVAVFVCFLAKNLSSVSWYGVAGHVGGLCGIVHWAKNALLMRGGPCAAELRLIGLGMRSRCAKVCVFVL
jgi:hypothetical protein